MTATAKALRLVFLGSPAFALPSLEALLAAGYEVALVVSQPDRPSGRGQRTSPPPVARFALERGLPLWQTPTLKGDEAERRLAEVGADGMALAAFGALVPDAVLRLTPLGILNVHPSLLPRWRGASPIQYTLLHGDPQAGVTIIRLVHEMDAGPILAQRSVPIADEDDYLSLEPRLARLGAELLVEVFAGVADGRLEPCPQDDTLATYSRRLQREDGRIDWSRPADALWRQVRALRGWPRAATTWQGRLLAVLRARPSAAPTDAVPGLVFASSDGCPAVAAGEGTALRLDEVVLEGRKPMSGVEALRGYPGLLGTRLGQDAA